MESLDVTIEDLGNLKRKIVVTVPKEKVKAAYNKCYLSLKDKVNIAGFRKGKYPQALLEKRFKKEMKNEAIETLVPEYFEKALKQEELKPAVRPTFDELEIDKKKPLVFSATFEIFPEVTLPEYSAFSLEKKEVEITDEEIKEQRQRHLDGAAKYDPKDGPAEDNDQLKIDFEGKMGEEMIAETKGHLYILGSKQFLPEFETALQGMGKGEEKNFDLTFPSDYNEEKLRNKTADFWVKVTEVQQKTDPELNGEFFVRYGDRVKSEEDFDNLIEEEVTFRKEGEIKTEQRAKIKEQLGDLLDFDVPEQLLQEEITVRLNQAKQKKDGQDTPVEELETKAKEEAEKELRFSIFVKNIIDKEDLKADETEVRRRFEISCAMMGVRPEELMQQEYGHHIYQQVYGMVMEETVLNHIIEKVLV